MAVLGDRAGDLERKVEELERRLAEREATLAERDADLTEALAHQTATAEVLQVINSSQGDLQPVFEAILDKAMRLCGVAYGGLWRFDVTRLWPLALRGTPPAYNEFFRKPHRPPTGGWSDRALTTSAPFVYVPDTTADEGYRNRPTATAVVDLGGIRSISAFERKTAYDVTWLFARGFTKVGNPPRLRRSPVPRRRAVERRQRLRRMAQRRSVRGPTSAT
jgi:hypothetical protein